MDEETLPHEKTEFERQDLGARGILEFFAGLVVMCVAVGLILLGMFKVMDRYQKAHQPAQNPLVQATGESPRKPTTRDVESFPQPRLETDEIGQLGGQRLHEEETLNTYGWVDQKAGVVHIPIERAMALIAQRGLPTAPQEAAAPANAEQKPGAAGKSRRGSRQAAAKKR